MNQQKMKGYSCDLVGSIHTVTIQTNQQVNPTSNNNVKACVKSITSRTKGTTTVTDITINPNKWDFAEERGIILDFNDFLQVIAMITYDLGISDYWYKRVDFRIDSQDKKYFDEYFKLHRLILSLISERYKVKNSYTTLDLQGIRPHSLSVKNEYFQVEIYDKRKESQGASRTESRFELRSTRLNLQSIAEKMLNDWCDRLDKSKEHFQETQNSCNRALLQEWKESKSRAKDVRYRSINDFLIHHKDAIFSSAQMISLLEQMGVENPKKKAQNFKYRYGIEYYSKSNINEAIKTIESIMKNYFQLNNK